MISHDLTTLCARLRQIPRDAGDYSIRAQDALIRFGIGEPELVALRHTGLNGKSAEGELVYADYDLHYLGLRLGLARDLLVGINMWRISLENFVQGGETRIHVTYVPKLPDEIEPVDGRVVLPGEPDLPVKLRHLIPAAELTAIQCATWPPLPDDAAAVIDEVAHCCEFCRLPDRFLGDTALARRIGFSDCWTGSKLVVEACRRIGRGARIAHGLMVALPFSSVHSWAEVEVDGIWTPVDPLIVGLMRHWGGLDPYAWPLHRSPGAMLIPLIWDPPASIPLVSRAGRAVPTIFTTRLAAGLKPGPAAVLARQLAK